MAVCRPYSYLYG